MHCAHVARHFVNFKKIFYEFSASPHALHELFSIMLYLCLVIDEYTVRNLFGLKCLAIDNTKLDKGPYAGTRVVPCIQV